RQLVSTPFPYTTLFRSHLDPLDTRHLRQPLDQLGWQLLATHSTSSHRRTWPSPYRSTSSRSICSKRASISSDVSGSEGRFSSSLDRKSTRLNSSHVKIS